MLKLYVLLAIYLSPPSPDPRDERGSVTIEHVAWAVAVIAFVAIVAAAIKAYVTSQAGNIK